MSFGEQMVRRELANMSTDLTEGSIWHGMIDKWKRDWNWRGLDSKDWKKYTRWDIFYCPEANLFTDINGHFVPDILQMLHPNDLRMFRQDWSQCFFNHRSNPRVCVNIEVVGVGIIRQLRMGAEGNVSTLPWEVINDRDAMLAIFKE